MEYTIRYVQKPKWTWSPFPLFWQMLLAATTTCKHEDYISKRKERTCMRTSIPPLNHHTQFTAQAIGNFNSLISWSILSFVFFIDPPHTIGCPVDRRSDITCYNILFLQDLGPSQWWHSHEQWYRSIVSIDLMSSATFRNRQCISALSPWSLAVEGKTFHTRANLYTEMCRGAWSSYTAFVSFLMPDLTSHSPRTHAWTGQRLSTVAWPWRLMYELFRVHLALT
jgi:hypothetical protein